MIQHSLKCWPEPFAAVLDGTKTHEVRRFDRNFKVGDELVLLEWKPDQQHPAGGDYTGRKLRVRVTHVTAPGLFGLGADVGVMSIAPMPREGLREDAATMVRRWLLAGKYVAVSMRNNPPRGRR